MDSITLKSQKERFINSINQYNEKYQGILSKINEMNTTLQGDNDKLLYQFIVEQNKILIEKINGLIGDVDKYKKDASTKIDNKISFLEQQERNKSKPQTIVDSQNT